MQYCDIAINDCSTCSNLDFYKKFAKYSAENRAARHIKIKA